MRNECQDRGDGRRGAPVANGGGQLFAPLGSTITLPSGNTIQLNESGLMQVVPPDISTGTIPVYVLPMDKIPMASNTDGTTNTAMAGGDKTTVVADATPPAVTPAPDTAPPASGPDTAPPAPALPAPSVPDDTQPETAPVSTPPAPNTTPGPVFAGNVLDSAPAVTATATASPRTPRNGQG